MAGGIVASSIAQEGVSRVSSYISRKLHAKPSRGQIMARFEMALSRLEFALKRTAEWPSANIHTPLIGRRRMLKQVYKEGTDLLEKLKLRSMEEMDQWVTASTWISLARNLPIFSLIGSSSNEYITSSVVQKFEWYADCADKFVTDVESGCPLRRNIFNNSPLETLLFEGKTLRCHIVKGSQSHTVSMWPVCSEGRGIEVELFYGYEDRKMPATDFFLYLTLRLSQGESMVGTAVRCLRFVTESIKLPTSIFNCVTEYAIEKITRLSSLQDISCFFASTSGRSREEFVKRNTLRRPDPICCANNVVSSELSHGFPEPVLFMYFSCSISAAAAAAAEYILHSSTNLHLDFVFYPHLPYTGSQRTVGEFEGKQERSVSGCSIQHMEELLRSRAFECLVHHPKPAKYVVRCYSPHGRAVMVLDKSGPETACLKPTEVPRPRRRAAKRKR